MIEFARIEQGRDSLLFFITIITIVITILIFIYIIACTSDSI